MTQTRSTPAGVEVADLRARVHPAGVPGGVLDELPGLYSSLASTEPYFRIYGLFQPTGVCILEDPHHVLVFHLRHDTLRILNTVFDIPPADAARACRAIFRALPHVHRIHLQVMFPPQELPLPKRVLTSSDYRYIELPASVEEYAASLGKHTRSNLRSYERRLQRDFPDASTEIAPVGERSEDLFRLFRDWKAARFAELGKGTVWEEKPEMVDKFLDLLRSAGGEALITSIGGEPAGMILFFHVGSVVDSNEGAFDPRYEPYALGSLLHYWMACEAVRRGAGRVYLGMGANDYLRRFGSTTTRGTQLSVFPHQWARLWSPAEAARVGRPRLRRAWTTDYWRARHAAGRAARAIGLRRGAPD